MILPYKGQYPKIDETAYISDDVVISGDVTIGKYSSIWFKTVIRGDVSPTYIGDHVNIQDQSMLHQSPNQPLILEGGVSVGHQVLLHSAVIRKNALIGMGTTILDGAEIGENALIGAGSLIPPGKKIPPNTLAFGRPAKVIRELNEEDYQELERVRKTYVEKGQVYKKLQDQGDTE